MAALLDRIREIGGQFNQDEAKSRHYKGMVMLVDGLGSLDFLRDAYFRRILLNAQVRKGRAYTFSQLQQMARPENQLERFQDQFARLVTQHVYYRGYALTCSSCALETWFPLDQISEAMLCPGCRQPITLPLELDFAYALNPLFAAGINQGALTVLLTALYLSESCTDFEWDCGYEIGGTDLDLVALCDGELVIAECKDTIRDGLAEQMQRVKTVGKQIGADRVLLATIDEQVYTLDLPGIDILRPDVLLRSTSC